jgi:hypothetical protein
MTADLRVWAPRVLGLFVCGFLALFALDAFNGGRGLAALPDFVIHLIPSLVLLAIVVASWRHPWVAGLSFITLAIVYTFMARDHFDWILVISGPLFVVGSLFLWASWSEARRHA